MRLDRCRDYAAPVRRLPPLSFIPVSFSNARLSRAAQQIKFFLLTQIIVALCLYVLLLTLVAGLYLLLLFAVWRMAELNAMPPSSGGAVPVVQALCGVPCTAAGDLKPLPIMCLHLMIWKTHKVGVVPDGVVSLTQHLVRKRFYTFYTMVMRRMTVLIAKLLQMAVLILYQGLVCLIEVRHVVSVMAEWLVPQVQKAKNGARLRHGHSAKSFTMLWTYLIPIRGQLASVYSEMITFLSCHGKWLAPSVTVAFLSLLLILAGDVELNPGPGKGKEKATSDSDMGPIEEWNREALISLQEQLKLKVIMNTGLINKLQKAAGGFMNQAEAEAVESKPNNAEQMGELIRILLGKRNADFKIFCTMLQQSNYGLWSEELVRKAREFSREPAAEGGGGNCGLRSSYAFEEKELPRFSRRMQSHYAKLKVVDDKWRECQSKEFVELALSQFKRDFENEHKKFVEAISHPEGVDKVYTVLKNTKINYKDIPAVVKKLKLVLISGAPGVGKSTLAKKLCQDISNKMGAHGYDLVLLVALRDLIAFKGLAEPFKLYHMLQLFTESMHEALQLAAEIQTRDGRGVLLILDGYDELLQELREAPFFLNLLTHSPKSLLPECDIVLTSRSILTSQIYRHLKQASTAGDITNIEVLGFTNAQVKRYAKLYFEAEGMQELYSLFLAKVESVPQIKSLCSIPVVLSIICRVFLAKGDLPPTLTEAYHDFVFEKVLLNASFPDGPVESLLNLPPKHDFYQLCEIAFSCVVNQKVIFTSTELNNLSTRYSDRDSGCGLLTARPIDKLRCVLAAVDSFFFIHLTVQEFLSAVHISRQDVLAQKEIWANYLGQPHMAQVWKFFSGLTKLQNFDALDLAPKLNDEVLVQSLYESQNEVVVKHVIPMHFGPDPDVKLVSVSSSIAHGYCFQHHRSMKSLEVVGRLNTNVQISNFLQPVLSALTGTVLQHLTIRRVRSKDWIKPAEILKKYWRNNAQLDDEHSTDKDYVVQGMTPRVTLGTIPLDVLCDIWELFDHVEQLTCEVTDPQQSLSRDLLNKMSTSLEQSKTMMKLDLLGFDLTQVEDAKLFMHYLLLGLSSNTTLTDLTLWVPPQCWDRPQGNLVQRSIERVSLYNVPLDVVCDVVEFFEHVKELQCQCIKAPQQGGAAEDGLKLEELEGKLAGHESLKKLKFDFSIFYSYEGEERVPQTLVHKFGVAAVRGVVRNKNITKFQLELDVRDQHVVDGILAQLTADERRKFKVGLDQRGDPSIELCPVGGSSSGGAPPSTDSQPTSEDTMMDLDRTECPEPHSSPAHTHHITGVAFFKHHTLLHSADLEAWIREDPCLLEVGRQMAESDNDPLGGGHLSTSCDTPGPSRITAPPQPSALPTSAMVVPTPPTQHYIATSDLPGPSQQVVAQEQGVDPTPLSYPALLHDAQDVPGPSCWTPASLVGRRHSRQWVEEESRPAQRNRVEGDERGPDEGLTSSRSEEEAGVMGGPSMPPTDLGPTPGPRGGIPKQ